MQAGNIIQVRTLGTVHFLPALATNAGQYENLAEPYVPEALRAGRILRGRLRQLQIRSVENLDWEVWLLAKTGGTTTDPDTDPTIAFWRFVAADAVRVGAAGVYHYYIEGLDVPYEDQDRTGQLHVCLVNRSVASKTANAGGALTITFGMEATFGH